MSAEPATSETTVFRDATVDDVDAIVALVESAYRGDASRLGWTTEADLLDGQRTDPQGVRALIEARDSRVVLGSRDGELVVCAHLERREGWAYFGMFAVRPSLQGRRLGDRTLAWCERSVRERWGCGEMRMTVISLRRELIAWYERRGYRATGETRPFPYGDERFGLPKRDDLEFVVLAKRLDAEAPA